MAIVYFLVAKLSLLLAIPPGYATPIWPAAGFGLVFVLYYGYRVWPGILIGSVFANFSNSFDPTSIITVVNSFSLTLIIGIGAASEALLGAVLIRRFVGYPNELVKEKDLMLFLMFGGPISSILSSIIGVSAMFIYGVIESHQVAVSLGTWWVGDSIGVLVFAPMLLIWLGEPRKAWRQKFRSTFLPLCSMFLLVLFFFEHARKWEDERINADFFQQTEQFNQALIKNFEKHLEIIYSLKAFYQSSQNVDRNEFKIFSNELLYRHPGVRALSWNPIIKSNEVDQYAQMAKKDGIDDFKIKELDAKRNLIPETKLGDYVVVYYLEPLQSNKRAIGFDISTQEDRRTAFERSRQTGKAAATQRVTLVQLTGKKQGFVVFLPVYKNETEDSNEKNKPENVKGYLAAGFETQNMIKEALRGINLGDVRLRIFDEAAEEKTQLMFDSNKIKAISTDDPISIKRDEIFDMAGRPWRIEFSISETNMRNHQPWVAWSVLAGGLLFTALLGAFLFVIAGSEARSAELVTLRTAELRESRERFELAVKGANDGIWDWNLPTNQIYFSPRYKEMVGYQDHEFPNDFNFMIEHVHPEDKELVLDAATTHIEKKIPFQVEFRMKMKSGDYKWILTRGQALWDVDGKPLRMVGFHTDISERKEIEKMKNQFFETISHELRTPLTPIHQFTTILQDGLGGEVTEQQKEYLSIILKNTLQLQGIIGDLVDVSRISTGKLSTFKEAISVSDFSKKIIQSFELTAKAKDIQLIDMFSNNLPKIWADPIRFEQVLRNLIDNAIKFTPSEGKVTIKSTYPWNNTNQVLFSVSDTGHGIQEDSKNRIFERLYQIKDQINDSRKGLGLGLFICKQIIENHGGEIWVESEIGMGSTFHFTIPIFSVSNMIQPIFKKTGEPPSQLGLIITQVKFLKTPVVEHIKKTTLRELQSYFETSLMSFDIVLPPFHTDRDRMFFNLIVLSDLKGVEIVIERLQLQWKLKNKMGIADVELRFSYTMMSFETQSKPIDEQMKMISSSIEHVINSQT